MRWLLLGQLESGSNLAEFISLGLVPSKRRLSYDAQLYTSKIYQPAFCWLGDVCTLLPSMLLSVQVQHSRSVTHQDSSKIGVTLSHPLFTRV